MKWDIAPPCLVSVINLDIISSAPHSPTCYFRRNFRVLSCVLCSVITIIIIIVFSSWVKERRASFSYRSLSEKREVSLFPDTKKMDLGKLQLCLGIIIGFFMMAFNLNYVENSAVSRLSGFPCLITCCHHT